MLKLAHLENNRRTKRVHFIILGIASLLLLSSFTSCSDQVEHTDLPVNIENNQSFLQAQAIREKILERAREWILLRDGGTRSSRINYSENVGSGLGEYRADCSGYVSYAWDVWDEDNTGGYSTAGLTRLGVGIDFTKLAPGDILVANSSTTQHALIFVEWLDVSDPENLRFLAFEENGFYGYALSRELTLVNCDNDSCEIPEEEDEEGGGRGPYTAYGHPEIATLPSELDQLPMSAVEPESITGIWKGTLTQTPGGSHVEGFVSTETQDALDERLTAEDIYPNNLRLIGEFETSLWDFQVQGSYAYIVGETLTILNISQLESPELVVLFEPFDETDQRLTRIRVFGNTAYILSQLHGVAIVDISNKSKPETLAFLTPSKGSSSFNDFALKDDRLFLLKNEGTLDASEMLSFELKLTIYDVGSPQTPIEIADQPIRESSWGGWNIQIVDSIAYVAGLDRPNPSKNIFIPFFITYDISNELYPVKQGELELDNGTVNRINIRNDIAYVSGGYGMATRFLDVSDPSNIIEIGYSIYPVYASETYDAVPNSSGSAIYIARGTGGLRIVDIQGIRDTRLELKSDSRELLVYDAPANRVELHGKVIFLGTKDGLLIIEQFD